MIEDFTIDPTSSLPVYEQIKQAIKLEILAGTIKENNRLAGIRELAARIKVNHNTIVKVYYQLSVEGFIYPKQGQGYFVQYTAGRESNDKTKLFKEITEEYINKSVKLGFSHKDIITELNNQIKG